MGQRASIDELYARIALLQDESRAEKVARRHAAGGRTARENIADLVDTGSFVEYGRFVTAAQEQRRSVEDLVASTPGDGILGGTASVGGLPCAVLSYDYLVLAGTQGMRGHRKSDRLIEVIGRLGLPAVFFAEGGGGRPGDTDYPIVSALDVQSFAMWAALSGVVPRIAVVHGRCFAGNAVIAGTSDLIVATRSANLGMAGPAMIAGGGLGRFAPEEIGPAQTQSRNGVVDVLVADEAEAVAVTKTLVSYFGGPRSEWEAPDQGVLREVIPERERSSFDVLPVISTLADTGSVTSLREKFAPELVTALGRIEGRTVGFIANQSTHMAGAVTGDASHKAARFLQLCDCYGFPVVSLVDTPGFMVGPEAEEAGLVRHASRLLVAGARLGVPLIGVVLRRGYGLGAQAMLGGSTHQPLLCLAWPEAHLGPMGLEGAVRLAMRHELEAIEDPDERERVVAEHTAAYREHAKALNAARMFEIDDVIDPAETRRTIAASLAVAGPITASHLPVDTW